MKSSGSELLAAAKASKLAGSVALPYLPPPANEVDKEANQVKSTVSKKRAASTSSDVGKSTNSDISVKSNASAKVAHSAESLKSP